MTSSIFPFLLHSKIVATLGPTSSSFEKIQALLEAGVNIFRLNFSHGEKIDHKERFDIIRLLEEKKGIPIGILMDLQGPKLRIGTFEKEIVTLSPGNLFRLDLDPALGTSKRISLPHPEIFKALQKGASLLLDDGKICLLVKEHGEDYAVTEVITGGVLSDRKGINIPNIKLPLSALTQKDKEDLSYGLDLGVDWVALSFIQTPEDIKEASDLIKGRAGIIAKIEKPLAVKHLEKILDLCDGVMVARGDLGVEMPPEAVPPIQKHIIHCARKAGKPVIVATQMLESMIHAPSPTRAEASDVATAIYEGADAVMLSAESASGEYPIEAVSIMRRIIASVEHDPLFKKLLETNRFNPSPTPEDALTHSAREISNILQAKAIIIFTQTGETAKRAARERPYTPILGLTPNFKTARHLTLVWGVHSAVVPSFDSFSEMDALSQKLAKEKKICKSGDWLVLTAGLPTQKMGGTNILRIIQA